MRYKVKDIGEAGLDLDLVLGASWLDQHCPEAQAAPGTEALRFVGRLEPTGEQEFLLRGILRGGLVLDCVRCLEPVEIPLDVPLAVSFVPASNRKSTRDKKKGAAVAPQPNDDGAGGEFATFNDDIIDLAFTLREELLLALPMNPGHDPPCLGICPSCGVNRDREPCDCLERARLAESPFASLSRLKS